MSDIPPEEMSEINPNSILDTIKKKIGSSDSAFDLDIITDINSALFVLNQIGVGPTAGFSILDNTALWSDFLGDAINLDAVKSYIFLKVKLVFDPPTNAAVLSSMEKQITDLEWRLKTQAEQGLYPVIVPLEEDDPEWGE